MRIITLLLMLAFTSTVQAQDWEVDRHVDEFTDETLTFINSNGDGNLRLSVSCQPIPRLWFGMLSRPGVFRNGIVEIRFSGRQSVTYRFVDEDTILVSSEADTPGLVSRMLNSSSFIVRVNGLRNRQVVGRFRLNGFSYAYHDAGCSQ